MEEQQDKDCYHYTSQDEIHKSNHVEAITRDLEESRQKQVSNQEEIGERLITLCRREQGQTEAWTLLDGGSRLYITKSMHEARIRRELIQ
jgi:hypothetical protein